MLESFSRKNVRRSVTETSKGHLTDKRVITFVHSMAPENEAFDFTLVSGPQNSGVFANVKSA